MAATQRKLVHKQFNSPIGMYSDDNVKETLDRELKALSSGAIGIDFNEPTIPANLRNSAVLRMLEEQEHEKATEIAKMRKSRSRCRAIIDRETVLKLNRRHKRRDYSWPPHSELFSSSRSRSSSNEIHFDEKVCKRNEISHLRQMFDEGTIFEKGSQYRSLSEDRNHVKDKMTGKSQEKLCSDTRKCNLKDIKGNNESQGVNNGSEKNNSTKRGVGTKWPQEQQTDNIFVKDTGEGTCIAFGDNASLANKTFHLPKGSLHFEEIEKIRKYFEEASSQKHHLDKDLKKWKSHESLCEIKATQDRSFISDNSKYLQRYKSNSYNELLPPQKPKRQLHKNLSHPTTKTSKIDVHLSTIPKSDSNSSNNSNIRKTAKALEINVKPSSIKEACIKVEQPTLAAELIDPQVKVSSKIHGETLLTTSGANFTDNCLQSNNLTSKRDKTMMSIINDTEPITHESSNNHKNNEMFDGVSYDERQLYTSDSSYSDSCGKSTAKSIINDSNFCALSKMATFKHPVEVSGTSDTKKPYETKVHSNESYCNILPLINENVNITFAISQANDGKDDNDKTNYIFDKNSKNTPTSEHYAIERNGVMKNFCNLQTHLPEIGTPHSELNKLNKQQPCVGRPKPPPRRMTVLFSDGSSANLNDRNIKLNNVRKILTEPKNIEVPPILSPDVNVEPTSGIWFCCRKQNENDDLKTNDEKCDFRMKDNHERAMSLCNPITSKTRNSDYVFLTPSTNVQRKETDNLDEEFTFSPWDNSQFDSTTEINVHDLLMSTKSDGIVPGSFVRTSKDTTRNFFLCDEYLRKCEKSILDAERHLKNSIANMGSSVPLYQSKPPTSDQSTLTGLEYTPIVEQVLFDLYNFSKILDTMQERCLQHTKHDNYITARIFEISDSKSYNEDVDSKYSESDTTATSQSNSPPKQIHADEIIQSKNILSGYLVSKQNQEEVLKQALNLIETSKTRGHVVIDLHDEGLNVSPCFIPEIRIISPVSVEQSRTESSSSPERIVSNVDETESDITLETSKSFDVYTFDNALQDNFPSQRNSEVEQQTNADSSEIITQSRPISSNTSQTNVKQMQTNNDVNNKQECKSRENENATTITFATATTPDATCNNTLTNTTKTNSIRIIIQNQESTMNSRYQLQSKDHYCRSSESDNNIVTSNVKNQLLGAMDNNLKNDNDIQYDEKCIIENAARHAVGNRRKFHRNDAVEPGYKVRSLSQPSRSTVQCDRNIDVVPWRRQHHMERHEVSVERDVDTDKSQHQRIYPLQRQHSFDSSESRYYASPRLYYTRYCEQTEGYKKVRWPPTDAQYVKGSTPQPSSYPPQQSEQGSGEHYPQQTAQPQYSQRPNQPQRPADHYPYQQQNTYQQQPQQEPQHQHANEQPYYQNPQSNPYSAQHQQPNTPYYQQQQQQHLAKEPASSTVSFSGGIPVKKPATIPEQNYQPSQYQPLQNYQHPTPNQQYQAQNTQNRVPQPQHYSPQQQSPNVSTLSPSYQPSAPTYPQSPRAPSPKGWHHVEAYSPARPGYTQPYQYQSGAPASVGSERDLGSYKQQNEYQSRHYYDYDPSVSQYQAQAPHHQQPTQYFQQHHRQFNKSENYSQEPALQQTNKPYAPPHQGYVPLQNQNGRGQSPGFITLRKEAPVSQDPAPIYTSQPAATTYKGGCNMRGDLKWPPPEYKAQAAVENEERLKLAKQPATRPLRVKKDYSSFFAKHALNSTYPAYKAPPGTQHYPEYAQY